MMRREWFTSDELWAESLPGLPRGKNRLYKFLEKRFENRYFRRFREAGGQIEYSYRYLPTDARLILVERYLELPLISPDGQHSGWDWFNSTPRKIKNDAQRRLKIVCFWFALGGYGHEMEIVAKKFSVSRSAIYRWVDRCRGMPEQDFIVGLAARRVTSKLRVAEKAEKK